MSYLRTFVSSLLTVCLCAQFAVACPNRDPAIAAIDAGNFALAVGLQERIAVDPACDDAFRLWLDEGVARLAFQAGQAAADPAEQARLYTQSLNAFAHWRTYVA